MMQPISGTTQLLGLIGDPVGHSLSPAMHNAALAALGENYCYVPFPVAPPFLLQVDPRAAAVGAVNTVYRLPGGGWAGTNTDIDGFLQPLLGLNLQGIPALILGCGGAARAVIQGCVELGIQPLRVVGRSLDKLAALQHTWPQLQPVVWADLDLYLAHSQLVINTTPIGMKPGSTSQTGEAHSPLSWEQLRLLPAGAIVYDLIYVPNPTLLLRMAGDLGHTPITGLEMLIQQGAKALSLWLGGKPVPVDVMRQAAQQQLAQLSQDSSHKPPSRE
ncbi:MAG: shikimate dehydrogenase [Cyanobacteriota bacterium]